jgi:hypothetical protein
MKTKVFEKEQIKEQIISDIKGLEWDINYHEKKLTECLLKMEALQYTLQSIEEA